MVTDTMLRCICKKRKLEHSPPMGKAIFVQHCTVLYYAHGDGRELGKGQDWIPAMGVCIGAIPHIYSVLGKRFP